MKALCCNSYGTADVLQEQDQPTPTTDHDPHLLLVRTSHASINPIDFKLLSGQYAAIMGLRFPWTPGRDFSGTVIQTAVSDSESSTSGKPVEFPEGTAVYGMLNSSPTAKEGTFADVLAIDPRRDLLAAVENVRAEETAGIGLCAMTAMAGLKDGLGVKSGHAILIIGASGGVGLYAVQLARLLGCSTVIGVCSAKNAALVQSMGATHVLDYANLGSRSNDTTSDVRTRLAELGYGPRSLDGILHLGGGDEYYEMLQSTLKRGSRFVSALGPSVKGRVSVWLLLRFLWTMMQRNVAGWFGWCAPYSFISQLPPKHWPEIVEFVREGKLRHHVHRVYERQQVVEAFQEAERSHPGKIVVRLGD